MKGIVLSLSENWGGEGECIKVYPRGQIAKTQLHFNEL